MPSVPLARILPHLAAILLALSLAGEVRSEAGRVPGAKKTSTPSREKSSRSVARHRPLQAEKARAVAAKSLRRLRSWHPYTARHGQRVAYYARRIMTELQGSHQEAQRAWVAGLLHDLGKLWVDRDILEGKGQLSAAARAQIERHPDAGRRLLALIWPDAPSDVVGAVLSHHEHWNGAGYPHGTSGKNIPFLARVLAVADAYDAMTSKRSYNKPMSRSQAIARLRKQAGRQFDPRVVEAFVRAIEGISDSAE